MKTPNSFTKGYLEFGTNGTRCCILGQLPCGMKTKLLSQRSTQEVAWRRQTLVSPWWDSLQKGVPLCWGSSAPRDHAGSRAFLLCGVCHSTFLWAVVEGGPPLCPGLSVGRGDKSQGSFHCARSTWELPFPPPLIFHHPAWSLRATAAAMDPGNGGDHLQDSALGGFSQWGRREEKLTGDKI